MATNDTGATLCPISKTDLFDEIKGLDIESEEKAKVKEWISSRSDELRIVVFGKMSVRKSTLVNGFVGVEVIPEGEGLERQTLDVSKYGERAGADNSIKIEVFDCSALQDGLFRPEEQEQYLREKLIKRIDEDFHLLLYCVSMTDLPEAEQVRTNECAIRSLTKTLGKDVWKNALVALTEGNIFEDSLKTPNQGRISKEDMETKFNNRVDDWKKHVQSALQHADVDEEIVRNIPIHQAGSYKNPDLPGRNYWQSILWAHMLLAVKPEAQHIPVLVRGKDGFKIETEVTRDVDLNKPAAQQPIIVTTEFEEIIKSAGVGEVVSTEARKDVTAVGLVFGGVAKLLLKKL